MINVPYLMHAGRSSNAKSIVTALNEWHKAPESGDILDAARMVDSICDMKVTSFLRALGHSLRICIYCIQLHCFVTIGHCFQRDYVKENVS